MAEVREGEQGPASADAAPYEAWKSTAGFDFDLVSTKGNWE